MICPSCNSPTNSLKSVIQRGEIISGCDNCISKGLQMGSGTTAAYYRREQQTKFRKELTQPLEPREFIKAYPERAKELYGEKTLRKYSH